MVRTLVTAPGTYPIDAAAVKSALRITDTDLDTLIGTIIIDVVQMAEAYTNRRFISQTWKVFADGWPADCFVLPFGALSSVTHVKYTDVDDDTTTWSSDEYVVDTDSDPGRIMLAYGESWPTASLAPTNPIEIQFVCGWEDADAVPQSVKNALILMVEKELDGADDYLERAIKSKLANYRVYGANV